MKPDFTIRYGQLDGVVAFLRVAERQSFRAAAAELGISPSAISQIVRNLEARVGVALLTRTTRKVGLTEAGQRFVEQARPAVDGLLGAFETAQAMGQRPTGLLRLTLPRAALGFFIEPIVDRFCAEHPDVQVELYADDGRANLVSDGFDAGIRLGELIEADMIALRLTAPFRWAVVGAPSFLERHGRPEKPEDLVRFPCICSRHSPTGPLYRWEFERGNRAFDVGVRGPIVLNDATHNLKLAAKGIGLAYTASPVAWERIARGELEFLLEEFMPESPGLFLHYPSRTQALPKLRAFIDFARSYLTITEEPSEIVARRAKRR